MTDPTTPAPPSMRENLAALVNLKDEAGVSTPDRFAAFSALGHLIALAEIYTCYLSEERGALLMQSIREHANVVTQALHRVRDDDD